MRWVLLASELWFIASALRTRQHLFNPALFLYACFALVSAITYDPWDAGYTAYVARLSDWLKALVVLEAFWIVSRGLDATDRTLSAAIGVLSAASVLAAAYGMVSRVSTHMQVLIGLASFASAMCWWAWRRGECDRNCAVLAAYLVTKAAAVVAWSFTGGAGWVWINNSAMLAEAACFFLWAYCCPKVAAGHREHKRERCDEDGLQRFNPHNL